MRHVQSGMPHPPAPARPQRMGASPRMEVPIRRGLFIVDIVLTWRGCKLVLEVDGPCHFASNVLMHPLGATAARDRCLQVRGPPSIVLSRDSPFLTCLFSFF